MSDYIGDSNAKLNKFLEAREASIEELKAILNDVNKTSNIANTAKVTGSWASGVGVAVRYFGYGLSYFNYAVGGRVSQVGEWVSFGGNATKLTSDVGESLISTYLLHRAKCTIEDDAKLLEELKSSLQKLEEYINSTATTLKTTKDEVVMRLIEDGYGVLSNNALPYVATKALPECIPDSIPSKGKLATAVMVLGDLTSLYNDWTTIVELNRKNSKSHFSQHLNGLIRHLEWQQKEIRAMYLMKND